MVDREQDVRIVNAEYEHGQTLITLERDMDTNDEQDWSLWVRGGIPEIPCSTYHRISSKFRVNYST